MLAVTALTVSEASMDGVVVEVHLEVHNPSPVNLTIDAAHLALEVGGAPVSTVSLALALRVDAGSTAQARVPIRLRWASVPGLSERVLRGEDLPYTVRGELVLARPFERRLPFEKEGRLSPPRLPSIAFERSSVERSGLAFSLRAGVRIDNPNPFPITVELQDVQLRLAGAPLLAVSALERGTVEADGERELQLEGRLDTGVVGSAVGAALRGAPLGASLTGQLRVGSVQVPFDLAPPGPRPDAADGGTTLRPAQP